MIPAGPNVATDVLLEATGLSVGYGPVPVVRNLNLSVGRSEVVAVLGANGAGKTTLLRGLAGELRPAAGTVRWLGDQVQGGMHHRCRSGLGYIPEGRSVFFSLSVYENLRLGLSKPDIGYAFELFPELAPIQARLAGALSGGEQQILAVARALARRPKVILADEISFGLAPRVVDRLVAAMRLAAREGVGVIFVEQRVRTALRASDRGVVLRHGEIVLSDRSEDLINRVHEIESSYLAD